ncbi:flagellar hook-associated protein FlgL [Curtobacterium sp. MCBD17_035]|uniref:flagellar hook-associated protein FlgL n=1 Tax=Curtobacterium sp. MCBD17_035 TaxID=2175673 RepID=UPI000DAA3EE6|nr:flagellar hook-associated protein FlgL [Curtobacterium sp. MCBD17_035]WIB68856.1 flagellar hook-associated protein FlgL [Curtobacterium sp. MCBD17_035]
MLTRVTTQMSMAAAQQRLQTGAARLAQLQDQASSLKNITVPSDDPSGTGKSITVRSAQAQNAQYSRNADDGAGWLATTDSALASVYSVMNKVRDLTVQGSNSGTLNDTDRNAIVTELQGLKQDLLQDANTQYGGRAVFAGNTDASAAYGSDFTYNGSTDGTDVGVQRRIASGTTVRVDTDGSAVFGTGSDSVFSLIDDISSDLQSGADVSARISQVDSRIAAVRGVQGDVGTRHSSVIAAQSTLASRSTDLEGQRSQIEDKDVAKAILDLQLQQTNYQAALAVTAKTLQPTLMDYLS